MSSTGCADGQKLAFESLLDEVTDSATRGAATLTGLTASCCRGGDGGDDGDD